MTAREIERRTRMKKKNKPEKMSIGELEKLLQQEEDETLEILPNGEIRRASKKKGEKAKVLTWRDNLGGEYAKNPNP